MNHLLSILLIVFCFSNSSCKKEAVNTTVKGILIDTVQNKVIANQKVIVVSCYQGNFLPVCGNLVASAITNARGEFEISFTATDNPLGFEVRAALDSNFYYSASASQKITPYAVNTFTLYARETGILKTLLRVDYNPFNHLVISGGNSNHTLTTTSIDTALYFKILPAAENKLIVTVWDTAIGRYRGVIDTLQIGLQDTTLFIKQIADTRTMPIR